MADLGELAMDVGASPRTMQRAAREGLIRSERMSPRKVRVPAREQRYVRQYWPLLSTLRRSLRTEPSVQLAVLFGSAARGSDRPGSDLDVAVSVDGETPVRLARLGRRLSEAVERPVQIVSLAHARVDPTLLADILTEGRVLVDRAEMWPRLQRGRARVLRDARRKVESEGIENVVWNF